MPKLAIIDQCVSAGGVERFINGLVDGMISIPEFKEWDVTILINRYNTAGLEVKWPEYLASPNLRVRYIFDDRWGVLFNRITRPSRIWNIPGTGTVRWEAYLLLAKIWIERECRKNQYDVVYSPYPYLMMCPDIDAPLVATPHDFNWKHKELKSASVLGRMLLDFLTPGWLKNCFRIVVSSDFIADEVRQFYPGEADKVSVVRAGIPSDRKMPQAADLEDIKKKKGLPAQFLLTVGWILPHKNQKVLLEACAKLKRKGISLPFVFTGPNSDLLQPDNPALKLGYVAEMSALAAQLGLVYGQDYYGLGYVSDFELDCLYRLSQALVVPTLYEAGSFPILEAVKARCPVLCANIQPYAEQNQQLGGNLREFDPYNPLSVAGAIEEFWQDHAAAMERAEKASAIVGQVYSWPKAAAGYLAIFKSSMGKGRR